MCRHVNEEYPVNIIVEPGVAEEVQDQLPFAFTPPQDGTFAFHPQLLFAGRPGVDE